MERANVNTEWYGTTYVNHIVGKHATWGLRKRLSMSCKLGSIGLSTSMDFEWVPRGRMDVTGVEKPKYVYKHWLRTLDAKRKLLSLYTTVNEPPSNLDLPKKVLYAGLNPVHAGAPIVDITRLLAGACFSGVRADEFLIVCGFVVDQFNGFVVIYNDLSEQCFRNGDTIALKTGDLKA